MSSNVVFVAGGQCGNQLGYTLLSNIASHLGADSQDPITRESDVFFRGRRSRRARCVCLDTEPKAGACFVLSCLVVSRFFSLLVSHFISCSSSHHITSHHITCFACFSYQLMMLWREQSVNAAGPLTRHPWHIGTGGLETIGHWAILCAQESF